MVTYKATFISPLCLKDTLQLNIWWQKEYQGLHKKGLRFYKDIYDPSQSDFLGWEEARTKFSFAEMYSYFWVKLMAQYGLFHERMHSQHGTKPTSIGIHWFALKQNDGKWVVCVEYIKGFSFDPMNFVAQVMGTYPKFIVGLQSLIEVQSNARNAVTFMDLSSWTSIIMVDQLCRGNADSQINLFFGELGQLFCYQAQ